MEIEKKDSPNKSETENPETKIENEKKREPGRRGSKSGSYMRRDRRNSKSKQKK